MTKSKTPVEHPFQRGEINEAFEAYFTGQSYLHPLVNDSSLEISVGQVTFEPGCRNHWHIHRGGYQILLVTDGEGWYQEMGKPARLLRSGDTVVTYDGVKHWHGATSDSWFSHLTITAGTPDWLEPVSGREYDLLKK
ncbi:cupin domain-containing protein [Exiguobacterium sp. R-39]|uniref:cupin domain-containing protein n=1 Tax=Exiguobacterium sp. R-39 TaxID=3416708 RepID=UPI003CF0CF8B